MVSTYTSNLRLTKQGKGDNEDTWGTILNTVLDLLDASVAGTTTVNCTTGTDITLTSQNGAADEARRAVLNLTGTPTADISVIVPSTSKIYFVKSAYTGNFVVTIKTSSGTGVTVQPGETVFLYCDGTDISAHDTRFQINGVSSISTDTTATPKDFGKLFVCTSSLTLTLPAVANVETGHTIVVLNSGANTIIIDGNGSEEINGATTLTLTANGGFAILISDGSSWRALENTSLLSANNTFTGNNTFNGVLNGTGVTTLVPIGVVLPYAGSSAPTGYLLCDGTAVSRMTYSALFSAIGTTYGTGDGSTTFNLPDLRGRVVAGKDNMGGTSANRLTDQSGGVDGDVLGDVGGSETHTLTDDESRLVSTRYRYLKNSSVTSDEVDATMPKEGGQIDIKTAGHQYDTNPTAGFRINATVNSADPHNNVQPTIILNYIIRH